MNTDIKQKVGEILNNLGIKEWGVCQFDSCLPLLDCRAISRIPDKSQSVIVCLFPYRLNEYPAGTNISKYAVVRDYHSVACEILSSAADKMRRLFGGEYAVFSDNSPIREVSAANLAGLGVIGKNGLLINPVFGSYIFIGEIVSTIKIEESPSSFQSCIGCRKCISACPGQAIGKDGIDVSHCLSHITQKKGELSADEAALIAKNGLLWGCDVCSDVCPMNLQAKIQPLPQFLSDMSFTADLSLTAKQLKTKAYGFRGKNVLLRNAEILFSSQSNSK